VFEYDIWTFNPGKLPDAKLLDELNRRGSVGWELIAIHDSGGKPFDKKAFFKRVKQLVPGGSQS
jgi:hypothetical protein